MSATMDHFTEYFVRAMLMVACACGPVQAADLPAQKYPDVVGVAVKARAQDRFDFDVTVSSPYDTAARYAEGIRAVGKDGVVLGVRELLHDHATEQPFTRDLYGVKILRGVKSVTIQARDRQYGFGGKSVDVALPGR